MSSISSTAARPFTNLSESDGVPGSYFEQDPDNYTVEQLKRWLKCRGLKQTGKRGDLIKRVSDCISSGNHRMLDVSIDGGKWFAAKVIKENKAADKSGCHRNTTDFVPLVPLAGWGPFPSQDMPYFFNYGNIHHYALESIKTIALDTAQNDQEYDDGLGHMTDKPLKNARKYVDSGFVHDIVDAKSDEHYFCRAHVWPSMRTDFPHNVFVILSNASGVVIHASCDPCKVSALGRCSHVVAVLLYLLDHVEKRGPTATVPCTSQPCSWNKGQKRNKTPKRLSSAEYPSKVKRERSDVKLIDFDPRPKPRREVTPDHINGLLKNLQTISGMAINDQQSMWETQLQMTYHDYVLDTENVKILKENTKILKKNLTPSALMEIEGTQDQSGSVEWFQERFWRLTASKCLTACRIGKLVAKDMPSAGPRAYNFIYSKIWKIESQSFQSTWMKYGLESEPKALLKYEDQTKENVCQTGLWVNPKFPFLGCSPDGLVENGVVEIKSLKLLKQYTIKEVTSGKASLCSDIINRQCFSIKDGKCILRHTHDYYYQIQMQLLVTERNFCDFVLYAEQGPISIERIYRNEAIIAEILSDLTTLWVRVVAPEYFEMRVPRGLHPFILPEYDNTCHVPVNSCPHTADELDIAEVLVNLPVQVSPTVPTNPINNLVVIPWGGESSTGIKLTNTCPLDNWLMIFQALVKSNRVNLVDLTETGTIIATGLQLIEHSQIADAKIAMLTTQHQVVSNCINCYGNEDDYFVKLLRPYLCSKVTTTCGFDTCPCPEQVSTSVTVSLGYPPQISNNIFFDALNYWLQPSVCQCRRKFDDEPPHDIPCVEDVTLDEDGHPQASWHCSGVRVCSERSLTNLKSFFIFSVDLLSRGGMLTLAQVQQSIVLQGKTFSLYGATLWNGGHYIGMFHFDNRWFLYDGMKENQKKNSGLSFSHTVYDEPYGYTLSYLIFCI